jgi:hypothetical protein
MIQDRYYDELTTDYKEVKLTAKQYNAVSNAVKNNDISFLILSFAPFIMRYAVLINTGEVLRGKYKAKDGSIKYSTPRSIRKFLQFYSSESIRRNKKAYKKACETIKYRYRAYEFGDIYNEVVLTFADFVNTFRTRDDLKNGSFTDFLSNQFHFYMNNTLRRKLLKDPLVVIPEFIDPPEYSYTIDYSSLDKEISVKNSHTLTVDTSDDIDFNWISGITCNDVFKSFTRYERDLIYMLYVENKTVRQIAKELCVSYRKLAIKINLIIERLRHECIDKHLIKE